MSPNHETQAVQGKKSEKEPNLADQYQKIGIKAVAAAAQDKPKEPQSGNDKEKKPRKTEKPRG